MKKNLVIAMSLITSLAQIAGAQQSIDQDSNRPSPEVHADGRVHFRLDAPGAKEVELVGDWMPPRGWVPGSEPMQLSSPGSWTYTTAPFDPDLYSYYFVVDGLRVTDPNNAFLVRDIANNSSIFLVEGARSELYQVREVPHGTVSKRWYDSPYNGMKRRLSIYTPPGYEQSQEAYPVLYLLHGAGGDEESWLELGRAAQIMDNLIARGEAQAMIVVMPNGNVVQDAAPGEGTQGYVTPRFMLPKTMEGSFESSFPEIMAFVEKEYRVKADRAQRAIAGLSMGGFHAAHISRYYPASFDYVGLFSAALLPPASSDVAIYRDMDATLKRQKDMGYRLYWIGIGEADFLVQANLTYRKKLDSLGFKYEFLETEGGHVWSNWRSYLSAFVPLLFEK